MRQCFLALSDWGGGRPAPFPQGMLQAPGSVPDHCSQQAYCVWKTSWASSLVERTLGVFVSLEPLHGPVRWMPLSPI